MELKNLAKKLLEVQKEVQAVTKNSVNPHFKNTFADINAYLEAVKPILSKNGLVLLQPLSHLTNGTTAIPSITTILIDADSGATIEHTTPLPFNPDPQKQGSAITYFRRYSLRAMLALEEDDDDGTAASGAAPQAAYKPPQATKPTARPKAPTPPETRLKSAIREKLSLLIPDLENTPEAVVEEIVRLTDLDPKVAENLQAIDDRLAALLTQKNEENN